MSAYFFLPKKRVRGHTNPVRAITFVDGIRQYEATKKQWINDNPDATPEEYQRAMTRIACQCGI